MHALTQRIDTIREQPHHVRRKVAFSLAGVATLVIAFLWLSLSLKAGAFAITESSFADAISGARIETSGTRTSVSGLAGAAAALPVAGNAARIEIIDAVPSAVKTTEQTVIPF